MNAAAYRELVLFLSIERMISSYDRFVRFEPPFV
jgi:hypothetical protein